ncbi:MAG: PTS sugar transporter subunit IIA [Spirochaetes bacterium]|nr:PTS sugar transporter subunit IIA [Spirochaetota bacterium]
MILSKNLKKTNVIVKARAKDRWALIEEMLDLAIRNNLVNKDDRNVLKTALFEREKSMSTGIGRGVAIPHCSTDVVEEAVIILALCDPGIDFDSIDNEPVNIAIFLLVPRNKLKQHIKTLADIAKIMNNDELREKLLTLKKPETILKAIKEFETSLN